MKKLFTLMFIAGAMSIVACGPSEEEVKKRAELEKAKMDSLFNHASMDMTKDSTTAAPEVKDTTAAPATEEKH